MFILRFRETKWLVIIAWNILICARLVFFCVSFCSWKSGLGKVFNQGLNVIQFSCKSLLVHLFFFKKPIRAFA
jgi:hypothetical protein